MDRSPKRRRWEDLDQDCLAYVFIKVGLESLLLFVPFVCKSWYEASRNRTCYELLNFPDSDEPGADPWTVNPKLTKVPKEIKWEGSRFDVFIRKFAREFRIEWTAFTLPRFMKLVVGRSAGNVKFLKLPGLASHYMNAIHEILELISHDCKDLAGFQVTNGHIKRCDVNAVVNFVPKLKHLSFRKSEIKKKDLVILVEGCRDLEILDVRNCVGFDDKDEEILKLAAHIPKFLCKGSRLVRRRRNVAVAVIGEE